MHEDSSRIGILEGKRILVLGAPVFFKDGIGRYLAQHNVVRYEQPRTVFSIARHANWADLVWVEWAGRWANYISRLEIPGKTVCRAHGYDVLENVDGKTNWQRFDYVFTVSEHMKSCFLRTLREKGCSMPGSISVLYNGINMEDLVFRQRKPGFEIGVIASVRFGKGYPMLVAIARELVNVDRRFRIHVIGGLHDPACLDTFRYEAEKWGLDANIVYEGHLPHSRVPKWLDDKNIILSASLHEGHPVGLMEAMACGIKPVIYDYPGAREVFRTEWVFDTVQRAVEMITDSLYDSGGYREWIAGRYSLEDQCKAVDSVLYRLLRMPVGRHRRRKLATSTMRMAWYRGSHRLRCLFDN